MRKRRILLFGIDLLLALFTCAGLLVLWRIEFPGLALWRSENIWHLLIYLGLLSALTVFVRFCLGAYKLIWRYPAVGAYLTVVLSDFCVGVFVVALQILSPRSGFCINLTISYCVLNCFATLISRFVYQWAYLHSHMREALPGNGNKINVAIVGAGSAGAELAISLLRKSKTHYRPICFIDSDARKANRVLYGLPVYMEDNKIIDKIKNMSINEIVIALPEAGGNKKEQLYDFYLQTGCKVKLYDYPLTEKNDSEAKTLREVSVEDLLFRESLKIENARQRQFYAGKVILVTGGGGSIGSEICRQIAKFAPKKLVIFDIYENNAYEIQQELIGTYGEKLDLEVLIGSVRDEKRLDEIFAAVRPQVVLHAAAHKHVPLMEKNSVEAIKNNVFGTYNTANMAEKYGVEKFVLISTDKAVNPTNIMGASKRLCEMIIQSRCDGSTNFAAVRFGNVLGSNGSVIPLFKRQIEKGGPITVTDKRIIRYFMTIPEATSLVLEAGAMARSGELFVLDMGQPVRIYDLAVNMIKLAGLVPNEDIKITEVGLRPGEKLYEELLIESEQITKTDNTRIFIEKDLPLTREQINQKLVLLKQACEVSTNESVKNALQQAVPTFKAPETVNGRIK